ALSLNQLTVDQPVSGGFVLRETSAALLGLRLRGSAHLSGDFADWFPLGLPGRGRRRRLAPPRLDRSLALSPAAGGARAPGRALPRGRGGPRDWPVLARGSRDPQGPPVGPPSGTGRLSCRGFAAGGDEPRAPARARGDHPGLARRRSRAWIRDGARRAVPPRG